MIDISREHQLWGRTTTNVDRNAIDLPIEPTTPARRPELRVVPKTLPSSCGMRRQATPRLPRRQQNEGAATLLAVVFGAWAIAASLTTAWLAIRMFTS